MVSTSDGYRQDYVSFAVFVTFPYVILDQVWYLIVSIPALFLTLMPYHVLRKIWYVH